MSTLIFSRFFLTKGVRLAPEIKKKIQEGSLTLSFNTRMVSLLGSIGQASWYVATPKHLDLPFRDFSHSYGMLCKNSLWIDDQSLLPVVIVHRYCNKLPVLQSHGPGERPCLVWSCERQRREYFCRSESFWDAGRFMPTLSLKYFEDVHFL